MRTWLQAFKIHEVLDKKIIIIVIVCLKFVSTYLLLLQLKWKISKQQNTWFNI